MIKVSAVEPSNQHCWLRIDKWAFCYRCLSYVIMVNILNSGTLSHAGMIEWVCIAMPALGECGLMESCVAKQTHEWASLKSKQHEGLVYVNGWQMEGYWVLEIQLIVINVGLIMKWIACARNVEKRCVWTQTEILFMIDASIYVNV